MNDESQLDITDFTIIFLDGREKQEPLPVGSRVVDVTYCQLSEESVKLAIFHTPLGFDVWIPMNLLKDVVKEADEKDQSRQHHTYPWLMKLRTFKKLWSAYEKKLKEEEDAT